MIDLRDSGALRHLAAIVADLRAAAVVDFLLVGAAARDLLLLYRHGITPPRRTTDVDFAFCVPDWSRFEQLKAALVGSGRFTSGRITHRLHHRIGTPIDLIPFGGVASATGEIAWPPDGNPVMSVLGYDAALDSAETVLLPGDQRLAVIALPMLALLKLFAWEDRNQDQPRKDAVDLMFVLTSAPLTAGLERLLDAAPGLLDLDDFDVDLAGAWLLGSHAREAIDRYGEHRPAIVARATTILERQTDPDGPLRLIGELQAANPERARRTLVAFLNGLRRRVSLADPRR